MSSEQNSAFSAKTSTGFNRCQVMVGMTNEGATKQCKRRERHRVKREDRTVSVCIQHNDMLTAGIQPMYYLSDDEIIRILQVGTKGRDHDGSTEGEAVHRAKGDVRSS